MSIRILIVDDHPVVRAGVKALLAGTSIVVAAEADTGATALLQLAQHEVDLVLLNVRMPDFDGLNCLAKIKQADAAMPVIMFTSSKNPTYLARSFAHGAAGLLPKTVDRETLIAGIQSAASGETIWSPSELRQVTGTLATQRSPTEIESPLTRRENQVLKQLSFGLTNKEIGNVLGISPDTVKEHVQHLLRKVGVSDRTQAAVWAVRKGLV